MRIAPASEYADLELHNIVELDPDAGYPGALVRRIPRRVAAALENGAHVAEDAQLCELRFVIESGKRLAIVLTSVGGGDVFVYRGDFVHTHLRLAAGQLQRVLLDHENDPFANLRPEAFAGQSFAPQVWRVLLDGPTLLHGVDRMDTVLRPPRADEKPRARWLAYGSSITHGYTPISRRQCYVAQTARQLGVDALNLGLSGSCLCEGVFADYLASRTDWDFITCELGVNMRSRFTPAVFAERARYLVTALITRRPGRPIVLIDPFTTAADYRLQPDTVTENTAGYRHALAALAAEFAQQGVHHLDGRELLPRASGLTCDLVHPSSEGHTMIADHLSARLRQLRIV